MSLLHDTITRALRWVDPERAHEVAVQALRLGLGPRVQADRFANLRTTIAGLEIPNPVGLAAGFDKDARVTDAMAAVGFGFVECGTVTPVAQAGNPRPRLFRLTEDKAVINRMGFNNAGLDAFVVHLRARRNKQAIVGANVGANKESVDREGDYVRGLKAVWPWASYVTINISSPNTPGLRGLQEKGALENLLGKVTEQRAALAHAHGARPLFLKVAPDLDDAAIGNIAELAFAYALDAIIVSNTTLARPPTLRSKHKSQVGGLSGKPLFTPSTEILRVFAQALVGRVALIGVGGVSNGAEAMAKIKAGASAVQLYSALAIEGPGAVWAILRNLAARLEAEGFETVADAVGADLRPG